MGKKNWSARLDEDTDAILRDMADRRGISNSEALRRAVKQGIRDSAEFHGGVLSGALYTVALWTMIMAGVAAVLMVGVHPSTELLLISGGSAIASVIAALAYALRHPLINIGRSVEESVATDGGRRED